MTASLLDITELSARSGVPAARRLEIRMLAAAGTPAAVVGLPDVPAASADAR